jgi:hypothetical protein
MVSARKRQILRYTRLKTDIYYSKLLGFQNFASLVFDISCKSAKNYKGFLTGTISTHYNFILHGVKKKRLPFTRQPLLTF